MRTCLLDVSAVNKILSVGMGADVYTLGRESKVVSVRLAPGYASAMEEIADRNDTSVGVLIREMVERRVDELKAEGSI